MVEFREGSMKVIVNVIKTEDDMRLMEIEKVDINGEVTYNKFCLFLGEDSYAKLREELIRS